MSVLEHGNPFLCDLCFFNYIKKNKHFAIKIKYYTFDKIEKFIWDNI